MIKTIIVSMDENDLIGKADGSLPWHISEELKFFKKTTIGCPVIMGRITYESLPFKPLPGRYNIVVTSTRAYAEYDNFGYAFVPNVEIAFGLAWVKSKGWPKTSNEKVFILGGAQIYNYTLEKNLVDEIIISKVRGKYEGTVYFPKLDSSNWTMVGSERFEEFDVIKYIKL
jgi:dihydrofolate reductase